MEWLYDYSQELSSCSNQTARGQLVSYWISMSCKLHSHRVTSGWIKQSQVKTQVTKKKKLAHTSAHNKINSKPNQTKTVNN